MAFTKGSSRNPDECYEMTIQKGGVRMPPTEEPEYQIEAGVTKGSVRKPPIADYASAYEGISMSGLEDRL
ncbi:hypothetical protein HYT25_04960 [Candidatus Pacearchaeota archaeon]|nr:hypothetical protein [Candidatus Pacearchaeota archaeon]